MKIEANITQLQSESDNDDYQFMLICNGTFACQSASVTIDVLIADTIDIHCIGEFSCLDMQVRILTENVSSSSRVTCYDENACDGLYLMAENAKTQLKMYYNSEDIVIDNRVGYLSEYDTISCYNLNKYIKYNASITTTEQLQSLVENEFSSGILPCADILVYCSNHSRYTDTDADLSGASSCSMSYTYQTQSLDFDTDSSCYWMEIADVSSVYCDGSCIGSPSKSPTLAPTQQPTSTPSSAPSLSPSSNPTLNPTQSPTLVPTSTPTTAPSLAPSISPSLNPSLSPTITPTQSPTETPTIAPSQAPTLAPSIAPSVAPSHNPTLFVYNMLF
jgi:hypothetical protein